jgi:hypothetical protein
VRQRAFGVWNLNAGGLPERPSIVDARDRVVDCFAATHGASFAAAKSQLGLPANSDAVRSTAAGLVRLAFEQVGGAYDAPTPESLSKVVDLLAARSISWGVPPAQVVENQATLQQLLAISEQPAL